MITLEQIAALQRRAERLERQAQLRQDLYKPISGEEWARSPALLQLKTTADLAEDEAIAARLLFQLASAEYHAHVVIATE